MKTDSLVSVSPSFTSHSSNNLADIAARVVQEFHNQNQDEDDDVFNFTDDANRFPFPEDDATHTEELKQNDDDYNIVKFTDDGDQFPFPEDAATLTEELKQKDDVSEEEEEFEFAVARGQSDSSPVSADEIFSNGEILPRYPLFDRSLLLNDVVLETDSKPSPVVRRPLRKLFIEERETASCSSSEADDLDGITPGTYCIWKPKPESPEACKKSNSTGKTTSKRWKFQNFLHRSNSDGNLASGRDSPVLFFTPLTKKKTAKVKVEQRTAKVAVGDGDGDGDGASTDETNSLNKIKSGGNRRKSYLPYKPDLFGVFANVNGLSRNLRPF